MQENKQVIIGEKKSEKWKTIIIIVLSALLILLYFVQKISEQDRSKFWLMVFILVIGLLIYLILDLWKKKFSIYEVAIRILDDESKYMNAKYNKANMDVEPLGNIVYFTFGKNEYVFGYDKTLGAVTTRTLKKKFEIWKEAENNKVIQAFVLENRRQQVIKQEADKRGLDIPDLDNQQEEE